MNKKTMLSKTGISLIFFPLISICIITMLAVIAYFTGAHKLIFKPAYIEQISKPLYGDFDVTLKNRLTKDKKYFWLEANIKWGLKKLNRPGIYRTKAAISEYINNVYLRGAAEYAVGMSTIGKTGVDLLNEKKSIEKEIKKRIQERIDEKALYKENVEILSVTIKKIRTFNEPYKGEKLPPHKKGKPLPKPSKITHILDDGTEVTITHPNPEKSDEQSVEKSVK